MFSTNNEDLLQIKEVLKYFQEGYHLRNSEMAASFVDELYASDENVIVLGTGTGELFIGRDRIIELIQDDWNYWGDVTLEVERPNIAIRDDMAWIAVQGSVKYSFEDTHSTYPIRLSLVLDKAGGQNKIRMLDLSHPSYWVFEGKL